MIFLTCLLSFTLSTNASETQAKHLYEMSGLATQIERIARMVTTALETAPAAEHIDTDKLSTLKDALEMHYGRQALEPVVLAALERTLKPDATANALGWLDSEAGETIAAAEQAASGRQAYVEMQRFARSPNLSANSANYVTRIRRLAAATNAIDASINLAMGAQTAVALSAAAAASGANATPEKLARVAGEIERYRPRLRKATTRHIMTTMLYTYRQVSEKELEDYVVFAESTSGRHYHQATLGALRTAMETAAIAFGDALVQDFGNP